MPKTEAISSVNIARRKIKGLVHDAVKSAEAIDLVYISDTEPGIQRLRLKDGFTYQLNGKAVHDAETLDRIRSLVLPPAWENVWICTLPNGHLQATGTDTKGRKQYKYHPLWNAIRNEAKFYNLLDFGRTLPQIRLRLQHDLSLPGLTRQKVLAAIVSLMEHTGIRIGSNIYEKLYGSFGITTLKDKHVKINGADLKFSFRGKKGVYQQITLHSRKLAKIIKDCQDIPGKELFQFYDGEGQRHTVDSGMVNNYIKDICGKCFTAKDFRTWAGTMAALDAFACTGCCDSVAATKKAVLGALDAAAARLGNTRTVCKKYYVHPIVITHYTDRTIEKYIKHAEHCPGEGRMDTHELVLLKMLEDFKEATISI